MKLGKTAMAFGLGLFMLLAAINNTLSAAGTYGAVAGTVQMQGTFKDPMVMWRAITSPAIIWLGVAGIVLTEASAGIMLLGGAYRLWRARSDAAAFNLGKGLALRGATLVACFYFIAFGVVCNEWFMLWQVHDSNNLNEAFRNFVTAMLILVWVNNPDD